MKLLGVGEWDLEWIFFHSPPVWNSGRFPYALKSVHPAQRFVQPASLQPTAASFSCFRQSWPVSARIRVVGAQVQGAVLSRLFVAGGSRLTP